MAMTWPVMDLELDTSVTDQSLLDKWWPWFGRAHRREGMSQAFAQDAVVEQHQEVGGRVN